MRFCSVAAILTGKQKRFLRGLGHGLKPVVVVGKQGVGATLLRHLEESLEAHELVKVKVLQTAPHGPSASGEEIVAATGAVVAQALGRTLLLYRPHPDHPDLKLPAPE